MSSFLATEFIVISIVIHYASSQCSNFNTNKAICEADGYCIFNTNSHCICGQTAWNQDIAFIFDSSMSSLEWAYSTQFASDLLYYASPSISTTRSAILQTADAITTSTVTLSFGAESISDTIESTLPNLLQSPQSSFYLENSLQSALDLFNTLSSSTRRKILIIFASQQFSQSPCKLNMRAHEISTYTIAIGDFNTYPLICVGSSENDYEGLITSINTAADLWNILAKMEQMLCPHHPLLKLSEIQLNGSNGEQYIEIYNYGHDINDMAQIQITNIISGTLSSASSLQWKQGSVAVIYNTDNRQINQESIPSCLNCLCDESSLTITSSIQWCDDAVYIGCCDSSIDNACDPNNYPFETVSDCVWNDALSMISFSIGLVWENPNNLIRHSQSITFNTNQEWPIVAQHYALELKNRGYNNEFGSSWVMSCDSIGTPGDVYLSVVCSYDCITDGADLCNLNSGMDTIPCEATSCNCIDGYYAHYHTCLPLPAPTNCIATVITGSASDTMYEVAAWDGDTTYVYFHCERVTGCVGIFTYSETSTSLLNPIVFDQGRHINATLIALQSIDDNGNVWISDTTVCDHITQSPTLHPTLSPTYAVPIVPSCNVTLSRDLLAFDIMWTPINMKQNDDTIPSNDTFLGYIYYYNNEARSTAIPCCTVSGSPPGSLEFDITNPDEISISSDWDTTLTQITSSDKLLTATICSIITQQPTVSPTKSPTISPTLRPTIGPSDNPTLSPTLAELFVPSCAATVLSGSSILNVSWIEANFGLQTAPKTDTRYAVQWVYNDGTVSDAWYISSDQDPRPTQVAINDYFNMALLQMYCVWLSFTQTGPKTNCTVSTLSPTLSPTKYPSISPTPSPLSIPTLSPTQRPSIPPTMSPTFIFDDVTWCHAIFDVEFDKETIRLRWSLLPVKDSNPITPPSEWITYIGHVGNASNSIYAAHSTSKVCNITNPTHCWGQTQKILDYAYDVAKVTFYAIIQYNGDIIWTTSTINCTVETMNPTLSPTPDPTLFPTLSPTFGDVSIYLDNTACEYTRCGCISSNISSDCCSDTVSECDWIQYPAPVMIVPEKTNTNTTFYVMKTELYYPHPILVEFNIYAVNESLAKKYGFYNRLAEIESSGSNINYTIPSDCYFTDWHDAECEYYIDDEIVKLYPCATDNSCSWCDFHDEMGPRCNDITPNNGKFVIAISNVSQQSTFELSILSEGCDNLCDFKGEVFLLELTQCQVMMSDTVSDAYECHIMYPSRAYIIVTDQDVSSRTDIIKIPDDSYDDWLWFVLLIAVLIIFAASYAGFIWWRNKKMKESAAYAEVEEEHQPVIQEAEEERSLSTSLID